MHVVVDCRCLDEWDVFLDAVNRKAISQELLKFSLRNKERQFIFISPQVIIFILSFFLEADPDSYLGTFNCSLC
jgi:TRAP-type mannitol/chloroaromatic compound transport system permease large subunit